MAGALRASKQNARSRDCIQTDDTVIAEYLSAAAEDPTPMSFSLPLGHVAKARGIAQVAKTSGLGRDSLYKALGAGAHPRYETVSAVLRARGWAAIFEFFEALEQAGNFGEFLIVLFSHRAQDR